MKRTFATADFDGFRNQAKEAVRLGLEPQDVAFQAADAPQGSLFGSEMQEPGAPASVPAAARREPAAELRLPRRFVDAARVVALHRDAGRWDLLYRLLWRLAHGARALLDDAIDADVSAFWRMHKALYKDVHNCHAYVRFRPTGKTEPEACVRPHYVAWYEPDHLCLTLAVPHFAERFAQMDWTIMTPDACAMWKDQVLSFGPGVPKSAGAAAAQEADGDAIEALWHTYYQHIFNPARLNMKATRQHMPQRFWKNMPETKLIPAMHQEGASRAQGFVANQPAPTGRPEAFADVSALSASIKSCQACPWAAQTTQAVTGEGPAQAQLMLVGEQPGDMEDLAGKPFVGPAGKLLAQALTEAGIDRSGAFVTNAVKHFKFERVGKRRIHQKPSSKDVAACHGYLVAEWQMVRPKVLVCLGLTAALAVFGKAVKLKDVRGAMHVTQACAQTFVTTHPSAILRMPQEVQAEAMAQLVADLRRARAALPG